jgi:hypothetical protein
VRSCNFVFPERLLESQTTLGASLCGVDAVGAVAAVHGTLWWVEVHDPCRLLPRYVLDAQLLQLHRLRSKKSWSAKKLRQ